MIKILDTIRFKKKMDGYGINWDNPILNYESLDNTVFTCYFFAARTNI